MNEKRALELACAHVGADKQQVMKFRIEEEDVVLIVDRGKDGCPKYKIPLADLEAEAKAVEEAAKLEAEPEPKPEPPKRKPKKAQATPGAKRVARQHGIDLAGVKGSGQDGRITVADVEAVL